MLKRKSFFTILILSFFLLFSFSCVNDVKDALDDTTAALECANRLQSLNTEDGERTCAEQIADIDAILSSCREFLSQEEIDDLNFAKNNCVDN